VTPSPSRPTRTHCCGHPRDDVTRMLLECYEKNCFRGI